MEFHSQIERAAMAVEYSIGGFPCAGCAVVCVCVHYVVVSEDVVYIGREGATHVACDREAVACVHVELVAEMHQGLDISSVLPGLSCDELLELVSE